MGLLDAIPRFARANKLRKIEPLYESGQAPGPQTSEPAGLYEANIITSEIVDGRHIPLIDLDMDAALLPSSTPGHYHLYIDHEMTLTSLKKLVSVMVEVGIVQGGVLDGLNERGYTTLRLPHVKKYGQEKIEFEPLDKEVEEW